MGFIQPSVRKVDGHKVFALIGAQGSAIAYLDIPAGLDPEPDLARRVGVRGQAHFSEDLVLADHRAGLGERRGEEVKKP